MTGYLLVTIVVLPCAAKSLKGKAEPQGWVYVHSENAALYRKPGDTKSVWASLGHGSLVELLEIKTEKGQRWDQVRSLDIATLERQIGWVESDQIETFPYEQFPPTSDLLDKLGGHYLEDVVAEHIKVTRFLVHQGKLPPVLVCYLASRFLPQLRLQVFQLRRSVRSGTQISLGPKREIPYSDIKPAVSAISVRDLLGDGHECLIDIEDVNPSPEVEKKMMVIQRIEGESFRILWIAPLILSNLAYYPPNPQAVQPPEENIGKPGTVTTAKVEFEPQNNVLAPVWRGTIDSYILGRSKPAWSLTVQKTCPWTGTQFTPLP